MLIGIEAVAVAISIISREPQNPSQRRCMGRLEFREVNKQIPFLFISVRYLGENFLGSLGIGFYAMTKVKLFHNEYKQ